MATVELDSINKVYDNGFHAIHDLDLEIQDKEFLVLVGPSGCGKSTALRMIAGLESITGGEMKIGEKVVNDVEPKDRDIAMVFQNYALYPHMSVYDNIGFALKLAKVPKEEIDQRVRKAAEILELTANLDRKPGQLSGGQRQRVAMGRAIVRQPAAFLMDEPLSNLDATLRAETRAELVALHRRLGTTIVFVTHDQTEAMTMADRVAILVDGRLQQVGAPDEIYDRPANRFVARFVGVPPMNTWPGLVDGDGVSVGGVRIAPAPAGVAPGVVTVGVRPEALTPAPVGTPGALAVDVTLVESLGHERLVHGTLAGVGSASGPSGGATEVDDMAVVVRTGHRVDVPRQGGVLHVVADPAELHFFDAATGEALR